MQIRPQKLSAYMFFCYCAKVIVYCRFCPTVSHRELAPNLKQKGIEKPKLVWMFLRIGETGLPVFSS